MSETESRDSLGLVGLGLMGSAMTARLLHAGFRIVGWDVDPSRREVLRAAGGTPAASLDAVFQCPRILLSLPSHETVSAVLTSARDCLRSGHVVLDTSTGDPDAAVQQARTLGKQDVVYLDATVSGSSQHLRDGTAVFLVGGPAAAFETCRDVFSALAAKFYSVGEVGAGARMKLVTNLVLGLNRAALAEGLWFAAAQGLDLDQTLFLLKESLAYSRIMETKGEKMIRGDFTPQARLSQHWKDVHLMQSVAAACRIDLPLTDAHERLLCQAMELGLGDLDNSALIRGFRAMSQSEAD